MQTKHFFVYHNPDRMPYNITKMKTFEAFSNKDKPPVQGNRIWVAGGVGSPRSYYLGGTFICENIKSGKHGFKFNMWGKKGCLFASAVPIHRSKPWFIELQHVTGKFKFGLTEITNNKTIIKELASLASKGGCKLVP